MTDFWLSRLFFDVSRNRGLAAELRTNPSHVLDRYPLEPDVREAVEAMNVGFLAKRVNPYLLRYYFTACGMSDQKFIEGLRGTGAETAHG